MQDPVTGIVDAIRARAPGFSPRIGIQLGSGLGPLAEEIAEPVKIPYADLPHYPTTRVEGHSGQVWLGQLGGLPVVCLQGRSHQYEGLDPNKARIPMRMLKQLGCEFVILTNAAGSLRTDMPAGSLMIIRDHINLQPINPLAGLNDDAYGPRFPGMEDAYDSHLRGILRDAAAAAGEPMDEGIYVSVLGPSFETPAEIRAFRILGGDAVGMSTAAECIAARHCGLKVLGISLITNLGAGLDDQPIDHERTLAEAGKAGRRLSIILTEFLKRIDR